MDPVPFKTKAEADTASSIARYRCRIERYPLLLVEPSPARAGLLARAAEILGMRRPEKPDGG